MPSQAHPDPETSRHGCIDSRLGRLVVLALLWLLRLGRLVVLALLWLLRFGRLVVLALLWLLFSCETRWAKYADQMSAEVLPQ